MSRGVNRKLVAFLVPLLLPGAAPFAHGLEDRGVFGDLDPRVSLPLRPPPSPVDAVIVPRHRVLVLLAGGAPLKAYPLGDGIEIVLGAERVRLRPADAAEVAPLVAGRPVRVAETVPGGDRDGDGIPDALDILLGAKKVALNGARYEGGYVRLPFPGGDVPREIGVCTDVVVRALRNAGIDLQLEVHADIARAPRAYPMVKRRDANIDHRRVKTLLPWFRRHFAGHGTDPRSAADPFLPGDVVFFDTFPNRAGPDHIGVVSDRLGDSGLPLVVNNWTDGTRESEMDLLSFVPVTHRFRVRAPAPRPR
jgi:uncharacterized protein YijF (DUF1287 family)